jgi:murein DD-endopeptidase MepM/ murein hydrolase activator NlpD
MRFAMTAMADRSRFLVAAVMLGVLAASCVEVEDASDKKKRTADSAAGSLASTPAAQPPASPTSARFGPDSVTRIQGGPQWTAAERAELQRDTAHSITEIDTTIVRMPALPAPPGASPGAPSSTRGAMPANGDASELAAEGLIIPVRGIQPSQLRDTYNEQRGGGVRAHEALDIPAPRGTPVLSATGGRVLKLFDSKAGGKMVYAADSSERFILMYAHLDSYANGLAEGQPLTRGQVIGAVGTTGNAPPNLPHLHFAIARSNDVKVWWKGMPVNPYPSLVGGK